MEKLPATVTLLLLPVLNVPLVNVRWLFKTRASCKVRMAFPAKLRA